MSDSTPADAGVQPSSPGQNGSSAAAQRDVDASSASAPRADSTANAPASPPPKGDSSSKGGPGQGQQEAPNASAENSSNMLGAPRPSPSHSPPSRSPPFTPHRPTALRSGASTARRTPGTASRRTPAVAQQNGNTGKARQLPKSPHVIRAWEMKRATTPGRERRKSSRFLQHLRGRDSPMDILKKLSQNLAPKSKPYYLDATPKSSAPSSRRESVVFLSDPEIHENEDDEEDKPLPPPPRLSLDPDAIVDIENEQFTRRPPPRLSEVSTFSQKSLGSQSVKSQPGNDSLEDSSLMDTTLGSIELPRRAAPEYNRMSFGIRLSDRFHDLDELGQEEFMLPFGDTAMDNTAAESDFDDDNVEAGQGYEGLFLGDNTGDIARLGLHLEENDTGMADISREFNVGLDDDSLGGFQLQVPELIEDGEEGDAGKDADETGEQPNVENELEVDDDENMQGDGGMILDYEGSPTERDSTVPLDEDSFMGARGSQTKSAAALAPVGIGVKKSTAATVKELRLSKHGIPVPTLPARIVKKLASNFAGGKSISNEALAQIMKASDAFWENASVAVGSYAEHAGRKTVVSADAELLLKRQRHINPQSTVFSLAEKYLPRELMQEIRMPVPPKKVARKARASEGRSKGKGRALDDVQEE